MQMLAQLRTRQNMLMMGVLFSLATCSTALFGQSARGAETSDQKQILSEILAIWQNRQKSIRNLNVVWEIDRGQPQFVWSTYQTDDGSPTRAASSDQHRLSLSEGKVRFESPRWHQEPQLEFSGYSQVRHKGLSGSDNSKAFALAREQGFSEDHPQLRQPHQLTSLFDGRRLTDYFHAAAGGTDFVRLSVVAQISKGRHPWVAQSLYRPLLLAMRPFGLEQNLISPSAFQLIQTDARLRGRSCVVLEYPGPSGMSGRCWVDPQHDASILRNLLLREGKIMEQVDIQYQNTPEHGWMPESWTLILKSHFEDYPGRRRSLQFVHCENVELEIPEQINPDAFQLTYSPGTYVIDEIQKRNSLIQENGKPRPLAIHEIAQLDLLNQFGRPDQGGLPLWLLISVVLLAAVGLIYLKRRFSPRKRISTQSQSSEAG